MKKLIFSALSVLFSIMIFNSCDDTFDDLMTADVKTGGILSATESIPYKLGSTPKVDITIDIPKGPGITGVEIYRTYTGKAKVLDQTVSVGAANVSADVSKQVSFTYSQLSAGLGMPADESVLTIGHKWTLSYVSVMEDGRKVDVSGKTEIAVANFFAGAYVKDIKYFHPTAGGTYPTTPYSAYTENVNLRPLNASECDEWFGVWEDTKVVININQTTNAVTLSFPGRSDVNSGDPNNPDNISSYNPATGVIKLYYNYAGSGGFRIFWVVYTPR